MCFFFFKFFMKNSCCRAHDWSKNVNSVTTTLYFGPKKSIWCPFFLFLTKNLLLYVNILSKNVHSLKRYSSHLHVLSKKMLLSCPYFVKKRPFSQKHCALKYFFFKFLYKKPPAVIPIFGPKNVNSVKNTHYGPKKSIGCHFFPFFHEKITA